MNGLIIYNGSRKDVIQSLYQLMAFAEDNHINITKSIITAPENSEELSYPLETTELYKYIEGIEPVHILDEIMKDFESEMAASDIIITDTSDFSIQLAARAGQRLNRKTYQDITDMSFTEDNIILNKSCFTNMMTIEYPIGRVPVIISFNPKTEHVLNNVSADSSVNVHHIKNAPAYVSCETVEDQDVTNPDFYIIAGRGVKNEEALDSIRKRTLELNISFGVTKPVVMNGWADVSELIGVSGKSISPKVAILLGVSGSPALYSGVEKAGKIIAVNTDSNAPITRKSDLVIVEDCMDFFDNLYRRMTEK